MTEPVPEGFDSWWDYENETHDAYKGFTEHARLMWAVWTLAIWEDTIRLGSRYQLVREHWDARLELDGRHRETLDRLLLDGWAGTWQELVWTVEAIERKE